MASSGAQDLIVDGAELSHPITIKRGKTSRIYQVIAYPTQLTRKTTNGFLDGTITADPKTIKKCRWHTAGIIRFHVNPETGLIYEARPDLNELEVTLECFLEESHKEQLALRAEEIYGVEFSADNFVICPFQTFMAQLTIRVSGVTKTLYGILVDNKELHPMRIIFNIEDSNEIMEIASKLDQPRDHDIVLRYDYSLGGTSTARSSLTINAEDVNKIDLDKQIFGNSKAESMLVSRSMMDKITASITTKLHVVEDIGVGGSSFGQDLIKQEISNALSASGFQKFSIDDIKKMQSDDTDVTDDLKADIINSTSATSTDSSESSHHSLDQSSSADSSDMLHEKSDSDRRAGGQSTSSSSSFGLNATISGFGGGFNTSKSNSQSTNFDNSNSSAKKDHEIVSTEASNLNEKSGSNASSKSASNSVQGVIRKAKNIDATLVHRSNISKGFTISLSKWHHQLATTSIKGRLTTKADIEMPEEVQAKEEAEREKQARKEEEKRKALSNARSQECELTSQQIDHLLHRIDSLDEDKLQEMHVEFLELSPDGRMTRDVFSNVFRKLYPGGKANNYCRYAFNIFDQDNTGTLNFTEYVTAMHIHESDDAEESLGLAFDIFDYDKSGEIDQKEILHMITSTSELMGKPCDTSSARNLAKKILDSCDKNRVGKITKQEFVNGARNNKEFCRIVLPNFEQIVDSLDPNYEGDLEQGKKHGRGVYHWPDGSRYEGQWVDDKQHGKGTFRWPDGRQYEGDWQQGLKDGNGIETLSDGERYEGEWKDDKKNGRGVLLSSDGTRFEGQWTNDKKSGKGVCTWSDGRRYEGEMKDNLKHGYGIETLPNGERYEGPWENDKKNGRGVLLSSDGTRFEGQWTNDKKSGKGVRTWSDGRQYEGEMKDNLKHGYGIETLPNGERYEGQWENDKKNGKGIQTTEKGSRYDGQWKDDSKDGQGVCVYKSGDQYTGQWKDDTFNGKGLYKWSSGTQYEGDFKDGLSDGFGIEVTSKGRKYEGKWKKDKKHGNGTLTLPNGNRFEGEWKDDERNPNGRLFCPSGMQWNGHINDNLMETAR